MKKIINTFILATIGVIFMFDTFVYAIGNDSISENITEWINASTTNLIIFIGGVLLVSIHWIFGKYKD